MDDLNLGFTREDDPERVRANRRVLLDALGGVGSSDDNSFQAAGGDLVGVRQVHSSRVHAVSGPGTEVLEGDGLMTSTPGFLLGIQTADCVPVLVVDVKQRVVAGFHAGWRGTAGRIVEQGIAQMQVEFGSHPQDLLGAVGPAIGVCCYGVGEEVRERFTSEFRYGAELFQGDRHLDLAEANRRQMLDAGLAASRISLLGECTVCARAGDGAPKYFSYRREAGVTGRMLSVIGVAPV